MINAHAIWMAVQQPAKTVAVKTEEQQAVLSLHKIRRQQVKFRTAQINALHGLLLEFGETVHKGRAALDKAMPEVFEWLKEKLPLFLVYQIEDLYLAAQ